MRGRGAERSCRAAAVHARDCHRMPISPARLSAMGRRGCGHVLSRPEGPARLTANVHENRFHYNLAGRARLAVAGGGLSWIRAAIRMPAASQEVNIRRGARTTRTHEVADEFYAEDTHGNGGIGRRNIGRNGDRVPRRGTQRWR
jgi:hypothetical protein